MKEKDGDLVRVPKRIFIDVETTGLSEWKNSIIQIAGIIEIDGEEMDDFNTWLAIRKEEQVSEVALELIGKTKEEIDQMGIERKEGFEDLKNTLDAYVDPYNKTDKFLFYGYNSPFDNKFLRAFWKEHNDKFFGSYFYNPDICVMRMAAEYIGDDRTAMKDFKQNSVATKLGIEYEESELHDAMADIRLTRAIYKHIKEKGA